MSESNTFKLPVDHVLSQISDLDRCANIFSIVAFFLLTVLIYDMLAIILSAIVMKSKYTTSILSTVHLEFLQSFLYFRND